MRRKARSYTIEFKQKAVELTYARGSIVEICRELDIPRSVLGRWRKEMGELGDNSFPGRGKPKMTDEQKRISLLENGRWEQTSLKGADIPFRQGHSICLS